MRSSDREAAIQHPGNQLLLSLAEAQVLSFQQQATGNILWALAKMQQSPSAGLLSSLTAAVHRNLSAFTAQGLTNSIWALAKLGHTPDQGLCIAIANQATTILRDTHAVSCVSDTLLVAACCQTDMS